MLPDVLQPFPLRNVAFKQIYYPNDDSASVAPAGHHSTLPLMVQVVDRRGVILDVSDHWLQTLGYLRTEVVGRHYADFITPATRQLAQTLYIPTLRDEGQLQEIECEFVKATGEPLPTTLSATVQYTADGAIDQILLTLTNNSARKRTEQMLQKVARATATVTGDAYFQRLVSELVAVFGVRVAFVTECANQALTRVRTLAYCKDSEFRENIEYDLAGTPCQGVINGAVGYYPAQLETLYPSEVGLEAYLGIPFFDSQGKTLGHLAVLDDKPLHCTIHDLALLEIFAARGGAELECQYKSRALHQRTQEIDTLYAQLKDDKRRLEQLVAERTHEIAQRQRVAETLRDLMMVLNSNQALGEVLYVLLQKATALLNATGGAIYFLHPTQKRLTLEATYGLVITAHDPTELQGEEGLVQQAIAKRQPIVAINSVSTTGSPAHRQEGQTRLALSLLRQGADGQVADSYGGIILRYLTPHQFSDEEIGLAVAFSAQAALVIENARLRQQVEQVAVQEERGRLARELHDSVTQSLYSVTLLAEGRRRLVSAGQIEGIEAALAELGEIGQQALKEMRLLVYELRPPLLEKEGLLGALHQRLNTVEKRAGIDARLVTNALIDLPAAMEEELYRIAQEALNNSLKHAAATTVTITLSTHGDQVSLEITDNGVGFDLTATAGNRGIGLHSMGERIQKLGGTLALRSAPGQGTTVRVQAPFR